MRIGSVEKAGDQAGTAVAAAVRALLTTPRVLRIYPEGHQRIHAQLDKLVELFGVVLQKRPECTFSVRGMSILVDGSPWEDATELATALAFKLRRRRIQRLIIRAGVDAAEARKLVALLSIDHKELLQEGGMEEFLLNPLPHIGIEVISGTGEVAASLPPNVAEALEVCFAAPETMDSLDRLRQGFNNIAGEQGADTFDEIVETFFARPEWTDKPTERIREGFFAFLAMVETATAECTGDSADQRIASIKEFFESVAVDETLDPIEEPEEAEPDLEAATLDYATSGVEALAAEICDGDESAAQIVHAELESHDTHENSLLILCELMVSSDNREEYRDRRNAFLTAISDTRFTSASLARILRYIAIDLPSPRYEHRDNLVSDVLDSTADEEALVLLLCSMARQPDVARPILTRLIMRPNPFALLVRLMRTPLLESFRPLLRDKFIEAGRLKQDALARWAREDCNSFFLPEVLDSLLSRAPELLGPICKDILIDGSKTDRGRLIERLQKEGTETSLRLLVLGIPYDDQQCYPQLIEALGSFKNPLAVSTLREIIHRNNLREVRPEEVRGAFEALDRIELEESWTFLWEVVQRRAFVMPLYRRELRQIAMLILEGKGEQR